MPSLRTFIAIEIPPEVRQRAGVLIERLQTADAKVKWTDPNDLHWTLKFLGDVDLKETPAICKAVQTAVAPFESFDVEAWGAGAFPNLINPRTVWIGMRQGAEQTIALHEAIDQALEPLGFRPEARRYRPHLTIGRVRQAEPESLVDLAGLIEENANFDGRLSSVFEVAILTSELHKSGPEYEPLGHAELRG